MAADLRPVPDFALRRARQGHWSLAKPNGPCIDCGLAVDTNRLDLCMACNYRQKIGSITINAEPWGLKQVRRLHGHGGESTRESRYRQEKKHELDTERVANMISVEQYKKLVGDAIGNA